MYAAECIFDFGDAERIYKTSIALGDLNHQLGRRVDRVAHYPHEMFSSSKHVLISIGKYQIVHFFFHL